MEKQQNEVLDSPSNRRHNSRGGGTDKYVSEATNDMSRHAADGGRYSCTFQEVMGNHERIS